MNAFCKDQKDSQKKFTFYFLSFINNYVWYTLGKGRCNTVLKAKHSLLLFYVRGLETSSEFSTVFILIYSI